MHIGIDVREACRERRTGKGQWTRAFTSELLRRDVSVTLFTDSSLPDAWEEIRSGDQNRVQIIRFAPGLSWHLRCARFLRSSHDIDLYVSPLSFIVPFLVGRKMPVVPIIHDLIAFQDGSHEKRAACIERWTLPRALKTAAHVCTVSASTKHDLLACFPQVDAQRVSVILASAVDDTPMKHAPDGRTILSIGTLCPRKNQLRLINAFAALPNELRLKHRLVLVGGRGWQDEDIVLRAKEVAGVEWLGFRSDEEVRHRMSEAYVFAYPSLYEGFGLPVLDAMRTGVPVLCSGHGSLAEVAGEAAFLVEPESVDSIRDGLTSLLSDKALRDRLSEVGPARAALFSWKRTVDLFFAAMEEDAVAH